MKQTLYPTLSKRNANKRDTFIHFEEIGHKYTIHCDPDTKYTSVTTWNHLHFPKFDADIVIRDMMKGKSWKEGHKYWNMTPIEIKTLWTTTGLLVSGSGTDMHYEIECFMNNSRFRHSYTHKDLYEFYMSNFGEILKDKPLEWQYFIQFIKDTPDLKPYRTEWLVFNEDYKISGSIDMVYENPDGTLSIYDWKRSKDITRFNAFNKFAITECICHLPDSNFWHYALQLNTYKMILEKKYGKTIKDLYLVRLHPDAKTKTYELIKLPILKTEVEDLLLVRKKQLIAENA